MRGTLRMPNAMVAASKLRSANGSASALASVKVTICSPPRSIARSRPTASMSGLISQTMTRVCVPPASIIRKAMAGERITRVEVRRGDLRWPLAKDFAHRLAGKLVTGLGRRAKYLLADLSSGDVLLMHLGMSGSFHVFLGKDKHLGRYYRERANHLAHDHIVFHLASGATVTF